MVKLFGAEKQAHHQELEDKAHRAFVLQAEKEAIDITLFGDRYPKEEVAHDQAYVADRRAKFSRTEQIHDRKGRILEAIVLIQGELNNWFGENSFIIKTSPFDDIAHGVDLVVELVDKDGVSRLALAIDVLSSEDEELLKEKLLKIRKEIENGKLSTIKYFQSAAQADFREPLPHIPRMILAADNKTYRDLVELSVNEEKEKLANHRVQRQFLEEIGLQLAHFILLAPTGTDHQLAAALKLIQNVIQEKQNIPTDFRYEDQSYVMLKILLGEMGQKKMAAGK